MGCVTGDGLVVCECNRVLKGSTRNLLERADHACCDNDHTQAKQSTGSLTVPLTTGLLLLGVQLFTVHSSGCRGCRIDSVSFGLPKTLQWTYGML